jgi:predicted unusual protein kinase regulating ubiquinone biosynthesis (AarF/ABC1/UbiB family)
MHEAHSDNRQQSLSQRIRLRSRYLRLMLFFSRQAIGILWWDLFLRSVGFRNWARKTAPGRYQRAARQFRNLAVRLGGVWIKVGQFLSARVDVLPESITRELAGLQDEVPSETFQDVRAVLEAEFERPLEELFDWFDPDPLASASLGQVHRARLDTGEAVVVKVQRPHIEPIIEVDLSALKMVVGWLARLKVVARRANMGALYAEFSRTLREEIDYINEAANAECFYEMFVDDERVQIPKVYHEQSTLRTLTLEDVYHIKITDYDAIEAAGVDRAEVADRLLTVYLHQIFTEGFFHADPHPGNLFVQPLENGNWKLIFVDFGMVGHLTPQAKVGVRQLLVAVGTQDVDRLLNAYQTLGIMLPGADVTRIKQAEAAIFNRFWGKSMSEMRQIDPRELQQFASEYRDVLYEMPFQFPSDLIFLGRCVAILSGMCSGLNPEFNAFRAIEPYARDLVAEEGEEWLDTLLELLTEQIRALSTLPSRLDRVLMKAEQGELVVQARLAPEAEARIDALQKSALRIIAAIVFAALIVVSSRFYLAGERLFSYVLLGLAMLAFARLLWWR